MIDNKKTSHKKVEFINYVYLFVFSSSTHSTSFLYSIFVKLKRFLQFNMNDQPYWGDSIGR